MIMTNTMGVALLCGLSSLYNTDSQNDFAEPAMIDRKYIII